MIATHAPFDALGMAWFYKHHALKRNVELRMELGRAFAVASARESPVVAQTHVFFVGIGLSPSICAVESSSCFDKYFVRA
jgi:hypothetical protein